MSESASLGSVALQTAVVAAVNPHKSTAMTPPKRTKSASTPSSSAKKKGGQALISRFFGGGSAAAVPKAPKAPKLTPTKPRQERAAITSEEPAEKVAECAPASTPVKNTPGSSPEAQKSSGGGGGGKRVLPRKRKAAQLFDVSDADDESGVEDGDGDGDDGDFVMDAEEVREAEAEDDEVCVVEVGEEEGSDDGDEDDDEVVVRKPKRLRKAGRGVEKDGGSDEEMRDAAATADAVLAAFAVDAKEAAPRDEKRRKRFEKSVGKLEGNRGFVRRTGGSAGMSEENEAETRAVAGDELMQKVKFTPLEKQFVDIKKKNRDKVLLVECGYKFLFFGEDALIASKVCRIYCGFKQNFNTSSVPNVALARHVGRLVNAGHKVGIVRQIETAALKKANGKSGTFQRELCEVYTRATLSADGSLGELASSGSAACYIAAFAEFACEDVDGKSSGKIEMALVAVDTATGDVVFDSFTDDVMRSELDSRLMALEPAEVIAAKTEMTPTTERTFAHYCNTANARLDRVLDRTFLPPQDAHDGAPNGLLKLVTDACPPGKDGATHNRILGCAAALSKYLKQFKLERAMRQAHEFRSFSTSRDMMLGADVMRNFELFQNSNDGGKSGSLLSLIDRTKTPFGSRRMKQWLSHPLTNAKTIRDRLDAVDSLRLLVDGAFDQNGGVADSLTPDACLVGLLNVLAKSCPDLERGLARISYEKSTPSAFIGIIKAFGGVAKAVSSLKAALVKVSSDEGGESACLKSPLLAQMVDAVPDISPVLESFVYEKIDVDAAGRNDTPNIFRTADGSGDQDVGEDQANFAVRVTELQACCDVVRECEDDLESLLIDLRQEHKKSSWAWKKVAQDEYLLEVPKSAAKKMPKDWEIVNSTKAVSRFRPRKAAKLLELLQQARETCDEAAAAAWREYLTVFSTAAVDLRATVRFLCDLDCLASHARTSLLSGYVKPEILDPSSSKAGVTAVGARHAIAESILNGTYVPNDVSLGIRSETSDPENDAPSTVQRCMVITGPNMGGKSSFIRMTGLIAIMSQMGLYVPAKSAKVSPFDAIFCRMGARDLIGKGMSTLMCELAETSKILETATDRSLVVLDELGRGTSTHDGTAIAAATLEHFVEKTCAVVLFVTHFPSIARLADQYPAVVGSYYLDYLEEEDEVAESGMGDETAASSTDRKKKKITFLYKVTAGCAQRSYGLNVAQLAGLPSAVIDKAALAASSFDLSNGRRGAEGKFHDLLRDLEHKPLNALRGLQP